MRLLFVFFLFLSFEARAVDAKISAPTAEKIQDLQNPNSPQSPTSGALEVKEADGGAMSSKKSILIPIFYYTPETQVALGMLSIRNFSKARTGRTSNILSALSLTTRGQAIFSMTPRFYFDQGHYELGSSFFASYYPNKFFGRGLANTLDKGESYTENTIVLSINGGVNLVSDLYLRGTINYDRRKLLEWDVDGYVDAETRIYGSNFEVPSVGGSLEWDSRDSHQSPRAGSWFRLSGNFYDPHNLSGPASLDRFQKYELDLRQYIVLAGDDSLALQFLNSEIEGERIPFQYLNSIGGGSRLRGFYAGRYREKALSMIQIEEKHEFTDKWVGAVFAGMARMSSDLSTINDSSQSRFFTTAGIGVHYIVEPENRTKLRLDIGFGAKDLGVYFLLGEAF